MKITIVMLSMGQGWVCPPFIAFSGRLALAWQGARAISPVFFMRKQALPVV